VRPHLVVVLVSLASAIAPPPTAAAPRTAFVTSVAGNGDLDDWSLPPGVPPVPFLFDGLAAGDYICQALAAEAGLDDASSFRAWLSDADDDAFCRLLGFTGEKADDCGQALLLPFAGPWARTDGLPFARSLLAIASGSPSVVQSAALLNENGEAVEEPYNVWTGTSVTGAGLPSTCLDWESSAAHETGRVGSAVRTHNRWTLDTASGSCDLQRRLLCLQKGTGPAPASPARGGRFAFVTSADGTGNLGSWPEAGGQAGLAAGDAICRTLAAAGGLAFPDSFKAWLSDTDTNAKDRFVSGPWIRGDSFLLAGTTASLTDGTIDTGIDRDELGRPIGDDPFVWTGTLPSGIAASERCGDWTTDEPGADGKAGMAVGVTDEWTAAPGGFSCSDDTLRLYCLSDAHPALLFADGFESSSFRWWSGGVESVP
jgi:hypothetical protein